LSRSYLCPYISLINILGVFMHLVGSVWFLENYGDINVMYIIQRRSSCPVVSWHS
jgi:hypothetical protein